MPGIYVLTRRLASLREIPLDFDKDLSRADWLRVMKDLAAKMLQDLAEIGRTNMPFGKYGPVHYPPHGVPIYDLPVEYLAWFARSKTGFPKGRLGVLLQMVHQMKVDGSDAVFDPFRVPKGGRTPLRAERRRSFDF